MHSAVREALAGRVGPQIRAWLVALAVQLLLVNALASLGALGSSLPAVTPAATVRGGLVFGAGMVMARG